MSNLRPTADELARLAHAPNPAELEWMRAATRPTQQELSRLVTGTTQPTVRRRTGPAALVLAAAAMWLGWLVLPGGHAVDVALSTPLTLTSEAMQLGPSIAITGHGRAQVAASDESGTLVLLEEGRSHFSVDPTGRNRDLVVRAGHVDVTVKGTVFWVDRSPARVAVGVVRGRVEVSSPSGRHTIEAGDGWVHWTPDPSLGPIDELGDALLAPDPVHTATTSDVAAQGEEAAGALPSAHPELPPIDHEPPSAEPGTLAFAAVLDAMERGEPVMGRIDVWRQSHADHPLQAEAEYRYLVASTIELPDAAAALLLEDWLDRHPIGGRRLDVVELHADLVRNSLHDCARALPGYRELAHSHPRPGRAAAMLGLCAQSLGRHGEAREAMELALEHPLDPSLRAEVLAAQAPQAPQQ